jgi:hypothetical protein
VTAQDETPTLLTISGQLGEVVGALTQVDKRLDSIERNVGVVAATQRSHGVALAELGLRVSKQSGEIAPIKKEVTERRRRADIRKGGRRVWLKVGGWGLALITWTLTSGYVLPYVYKKVKHGLQEEARQEAKVATPTRKEIQMPMEKGYKGKHKGAKGAKGGKKKGY